MKSQRIIKKPWNDRMKKRKDDEIERCAERIAWLIVHKEEIEQGEIDKIPEELV